MKYGAWEFIAIQITCYNVRNTAKLNNRTILYKGYRLKCDLKLKVWKLKIYITIIKPYEFYYPLQKKGQ